jgi:hypothetical protein
MSSAVYHIVDTPLPLSEDFAGLREEGLAYIQSHMTNDWTNLNASDPGITILDQLCYALTELGYCNNFSVPDILTRADGTLQIEDQFYLPEDILTTTPVTIDDYRKYVIDGVEGIANAEIGADMENDTLIKGIYTVSLLIDTAITLPDDYDPVTAVGLYLNKCRNLGEIFKDAVILQPAAYLIAGSIGIDDDKKLDAVLAAVQTALQDAIFPKQSPVGYNDLVKTGITADEIFNGPKLKNGWIETGVLGNKTNRLTAVQAVQLIRQIPGVLSATNICFCTKSDPAQLSTISTTAGDPTVLSIDVFASAGTTVQKNGNETSPGDNTATGARLTILYKGKALQVPKTIKQAASTRSSSGLNANILYGASVTNQAYLPSGKYRDINTYYSIQNTFPEIFRVGTDTVSDDASPFQVAQSRQLKGYLTLFDQLLANQFSQLANLGRLFSFRNAMTGTPSDVETYYAQQDAYQKVHGQFPVPYITFAPTYFYQSLYDVPHIRPLLKDNNTLGYYTEIETPRALENNSWEAYKKDPYNAYIHGLMDVMENESINVTRRNEMLDHLLARHGESPLVIDTIINGSVYSGESVKDKVIFKSLYLQNLGLLSYYRSKAFNFTAAEELFPRLEKTPYDFIRDIFGGTTKDFIFNSEKINRVERLAERDFINYSAVELKLCLLFGLKKIYHDFIEASLTEIDLLEEQGGDPQTIAEIRNNISLAMWMIGKRKGMIMVETSLIRFTGNDTCTLSPNELLFIFPAFVNPIGEESFVDRVWFFLRTELPARLGFSCYYIGANDLGNLTSAYTSWHDYLKQDIHSERMHTRAAALDCRLNEIIKKYPNQS